jgi:hypothetical protein
MNKFIAPGNHCQLSTDILGFDLTLLQLQFDRRGECMVAYRCYVLDAEDHVVQAHELVCENDAQAESAAGDFLAQDPYNRSVEVWEATRRLMTLRREAAADLRMARRLPRGGLALR